jgi:hypothetical protein
VTGALEEAGQRKEDAVLLAEERAVAAAWKKTEALAKVRHDLAIKAETQILNLYETYVELIQVGQDLHAAAPVRGARKLHNSMLSPVQLTAAFRMFMLRSGFAWAYSTPWGIERIPALSDKVKAGSDEIMEYRNTAREAA